MYFDQMFYNQQHVNPNYYAQQREHIRQLQQTLNVQKAEKATRDLCEAVRNSDEYHQQQAFLACLGVIALEFGWN